MDIRAWFMDKRMAENVRDRLVERGYTTLLLSPSTGPAQMTVTTTGVLRAEVEGLIWLGGGELRR